jgi:hypothetical protein
VKLGGRQRKSAACSGTRDINLAGYVLRRTPAGASARPADRQVVSMLADDILARAVRRVGVAEHLSPWAGSSRSTGPETPAAAAGIGCVALLALIAGAVSYLHMQMLVARHGQPARLPC